MNFNKGDIVRHFKGNVYEIISFAIHTETEEKLVIYQDLKDKEKIWARPYEMFAGKVPGKDEYRFQKIREYGDWFTVKEMIDAVDSSSIMNYDGCGELYDVKEDKFIDIEDIEDIDFLENYNWNRYRIVWFNK